MIAPYTFARGATIVVAIEAIGATAPGLVNFTASAVLKRSPNSRGVPGPEAPVAATFAVTERPAAVGVGAGWTFTLDAATSAALEPGLYVTNAVITMTGGAVQKSGLLWLLIEEAI